MNHIPRKPSQKTRSYRAWNWKAVCLLAVPIAIVHGLQLPGNLSLLGPFIIWLGFSVFGIYSMIKNPWITKVVYEIYNYKQNVDGSEEVEYTDSEMEGSTKMRISRSKGIENL